MELLHDPPDPATFVPLSEHQSATPASFFSGPPVLHLRCPRATLRLRHPTAPALSKFAGLPSANGAAAADAASSDDEADVADVTVYVLSSYLLLARAAPAPALKIPYPSIGLHAAAGAGIYLQLGAASAGDAPAFDDHDPDSSVEATIVPGDVDGGGGGEGGGTAVQQLYDALSACANLHPDPDEDDGDAGGFEVLGGTDGLPPALPGSGGWITAENMGDFFDDQGNWKGEGPEPRLGLGPGAGAVRERAEGEEDEADEDESKWQRTA